MKRCAGPLCNGELRPLFSFGPRRRGLQSYCRSCNNTGYRHSRRMTTPIIELEPDLEYDRREASAEHEEAPCKRRRQDVTDTLYVMELDDGNEDNNATMRELCGLKLAAPGTPTRGRGACRGLCPSR